MKKNNNINFLILLLLIFINLNYINGLISPPQPFNPIKNPQNNHYYQDFNYKTANGIQIGAINATLECSTYTYNGKKGYLMTITSEDEWNWAKLNNLTKSGAWLSGSDAEKTGVWKYSKGSPEESGLMYNLYFDKCYSHCIFGSLEPNLIPNEHWLHTSGTDAVPYINNNGPLALTDRYICEFGGLEIREPYIPTSPTTGSIVTITNFVGFVVDDKLSITFTDRENSAKTFKCLSIVKVDNDKINCEIPPGQGRFIVTIKDSSNQQLETPIYWNYELPMVGGIYPVYTSGGVATITGANFGTVASEIKVSLGLPGISCNQIVITKDHEVFTCVLSSSLTGNKFLPVDITVSNNNFVSYKAAIFYNGFYYSGFMAWTTWNSSNYDYASQLRIDGQIGHMGSFYDEKLVNFLNDTLPVQNGNSRIALWQNARYENGKFYYISGPNADKEFNLVYKSIIGGDEVKATWTKDTRFIIYLDTLQITNNTATSSTGVLTEYGGIPPTFTTVKTHSVDTSGGKVDISIDNYGTVFSIITVYFNSTVVQYTRDYINSELDLTIPAGFDGPWEVSVKVDTLATPVGTQFIKYAAPTIVSMNKVPTKNGGLVTITGTSFSNSTANTVLTFPGCQSTIQVLQAFKSYTCQLPGGTGTIPVSLTVSKQSTTAVYQYAEPVITYSNNIAQVGGLLSIQGDNFGSDVSLIHISIIIDDETDVTCNNVNIIEAHSKLTCVAPPLDPGTYSLKIVVDGIASLEPQYQILYFESNLYTRQDNADLSIVGKDLPDASALSIVLGQVDISTYCTGSGVLIKCTNLPLDVVSGDLSIVHGDEIYPTIPVSLKPWISSISPTILDTVKDTDITITGRYFELPIKVIQNRVEAKDTDFTYINTEKVLLHIHGGFGSGYNVSIENKNELPSNKMVYSFIKPEILEIKQQDHLVIINGRNFSNQLTSTTLFFGNYQPTIKYIDSNRIEFELSDQSRNGEVYVVVEGQKSNSLTFKITPILTSLSSTPQTSFNRTSSITINGYYLLEKDSLDNLVSLVFNFKLKTPENSPSSLLSNCKQLSLGTSYQCDVNPGYGYFEISATSETTLLSNSVESHYEAPTVLKVLSQVYLNEPIELVISVINFKLEYTRVFIEDQECISVSGIDSTTIKCNYQSNIPIPDDKLALKVSVVSADVAGSKDCLIYSSLYDCNHLNDCSGHGTCNQKLPKCICDDGWRGQDCSIDSNTNPPLPEPPIIDENGTTTFPGTKINFTVAITHLVEMDYNDKPVRYLALSEIDWNNREAITNVSNYYSGTFKRSGDEFTIFQLIVSYYENEDQIEFADEQLYMPENSVKYQATILHWKFESSLNYLVTVFTSKTDSSIVQNCDVVNSESKLSDNNQYQIDTGVGSLTGKFASRLLVDDSTIVKSRLIQIDSQNNSLIYNFIGSTELDQVDSSKLSVRVGVLSPSFNQKTVIDPSFGQLLRADDDSDNDNCGSNWKIPTIVVLSVVGGSAIIGTGSVFYYRKRKETKSMKRVSVSMGSMK